jgi:hypothetical protein
MQDTVSTGHCESKATHYKCCYGRQKLKSQHFNAAMLPLLRHKHRARHMFCGNLLAPVIHHWRRCALFAWYGVLQRNVFARLTRTMKLRQIIDAHQDAHRRNHEKMVCVGRPFGTGSRRAYQAEISLVFQPALLLQDNASRNCPGGLP